MEYIIDERYEDVRLDRFLRKHLPDTALTEIFKGLRTGNIKVNGKKAKENARLKKGDIIKIFRVPGVENLEQVESNNTTKEQLIKLNTKEIELIKKIIVYEDDRVVIVDKPFGVVMHEGSGHDYGLNEMLCAYFKNPDLAFVNRIDKGTSGLVIAAKTLPVARELSHEIREGNLEKKYYILVQGRVSKENFKVVSYLKKIEDKVIETDINGGGKESISSFKVLETGARTTLLQGTLGSGRTHQLRVQLANLGHTIVGDSRYNTKIPYKRMMLHSYYLEIKKYNLEIELPIPTEFKPF